ncbi:MAG: DUF971 domain-containing protein [Acidimicrobiia bacterium]|nr:DUF971 domain-containing protein [Acidimicrobiia bacterium]
MDVPERIEIREGSSLELTWSDGNVSEISASELRSACMCATCRDETGAKATAAVLQQPEEIRIVGATLVGAYAINFGFAPDGHHTGIYSFDSLRALATDV